MNLHDLSRLPFKERFKVVKNLLASDSELHPDAQIVNEIFEHTIEWFKAGGRLSDPNVLSKLKDTKEDLPSIFETIYKIQEQSVFRKLPSNKILNIYADSTVPWCLHYSPLNDTGEKLPSSVKTIHEILKEPGQLILDAGWQRLGDKRQNLFDDSKKLWCLYFPDFKRISDAMEAYKTNELLLEYTKHCPPASIHEKAIDVYKKCISFRVKLTRKVLSPLQRNPGLGYTFCQNIDYCIDNNIVKSFVQSYHKWRQDLSSRWSNNYYMYSDFFFNTGYDRTPWNSHIAYSDSLKAKADAVQRTQEDVLLFINSAREFVTKSDQAISLEYQRNATEMSLYEREFEISQLGEGESVADEEYCFAYTLECKLCVFYVGIAADPKDRFEQHVRGAFSDEAHLFKSKFIQKFHKEVKFNIVFEGTRRECKQFERDYIAENEPLGNMTEGGEG